MKATGIVRRIDDLGRVVVPKEIRRTLRIREGDPLEIFTDREGEIILKKYSPIGELGQFAKQYADSLAQTTGHIIAITDKDQFIAVSGPAKKDLITKGISHELEEVINERESIVAAKEDKNFIKIMSEDDGEYTYEVIFPIISEGD
ncbi:MAG TPA: stage V sporulation T C-terminal domain-containing protein, partial [Mobilitalea sp.]|nr:stage V sporulation T C-terminal domain-containing protein [Mobilitalea sp.]